MNRKGIVLILVSAVLWVCGACGYVVHKAFLGQVM